MKLSDEIINSLSINLRKKINNIKDSSVNIEEIRLRINKPMIINGITKLRKFPKILLKVANSLTIPSGMKIPIKIPAAIPITSRGSSPIFFFSISFSPLIFCSSYFSPIITCSSVHATPSSSLEGAM